jgi:RNA polymerase sigma-70 factor, ECF subfamily
MAVPGSLQNPEEPANDIGLLHRIRASDRAAIAELYDRYSRLLYGLIMRILRDRAEAEEVLQETFLLVWKRADTFEASLGSPAAWLVRIARNRAIDRLRANSSRARVLESAAAPCRSPEDPEAHASGRETQRAVARALEALPAPQKELIEQAYFLGLTQSELAERFGLPLGTVKTRIRSAMATLREQLHDVSIGA